MQQHQQEEETLWRDLRSAVSAGDGEKAATLARKLASLHTNNTIRKRDSSNDSNNSQTATRALPSLQPQPLPPHLTRPTRSSSHGADVRVPPARPSRPSVPARPTIPQQPQQSQPQQQQQQPHVVPGRLPANVVNQVQQLQQRQQQQHFATMGRAQSAAAVRAAMKGMRYGNLSLMSLPFLSPSPLLSPLFPLSLCLSLCLSLFLSFSLSPSSPFSSLL